MRSRPAFRAAALALALALLAGNALAGAALHQRDRTEASGQQPSQTEYVIVQLLDAPAASYARPARGKKFDPEHPDVRNYRAHLARTHAEYRDFLHSTAPGAAVIAEYFDTYNGFAVRLNGASPSVLAGGPHARNVSYSALYRPAMNVSSGLIGAGSLWLTAGGQESAGAGIKVGIIDTGIVCS